MDRRELMLHHREPNAVDSLCGTYHSKWVVKGIPEGGYRYYSDIGSKESDGTKKVYKGRVSSVAL